MKIKTLMIRKPLNLLLLISIMFAFGCSGDNSEKKENKIQKLYQEKLNERYEEYYDNGQLKLTIKNFSIKDSTFNVVRYFKNGKVKSVTPYKEEKKQGIRKKYRKNGKLLSTIKYVNDIMVSVTTYDKKGQPEMSRNFKINSPDTVMLGDSVSMDIQVVASNVDSMGVLVGPLNEDYELTDTLTRLYDRYKVNYRFKPEQPGMQKVTGKVLYIHKPTGRYGSNYFEHKFFVREPEKEKIVQ